jgi:hypothetical protein
MVSPGQEGTSMTPCSSGCRQSLQYGGGAHGRLRDTDSPSHDIEERVLKPIWHGHKLHILAELAHAAQSSRIGPTSVRSTSDRRIFQTRSADPRVPTRATEVPARSQYCPIMHCPPSHCHDGRTWGESSRMIIHGITMGHPKAFAVPHQFSLPAHSRTFGQDLSL